MKTRLVRALVVGGTLSCLILVVGFGPVLLKLDYSQLFSRASWQYPERVVASLELHPGARVADIGAGDGYFTFYLADAVGPEGKVFAIDVDQKVIAKLEAAVEERGYRNIEVILAEAGDPLLPDGSIDLAFVCNVYHHIDDQPAYFDRLRADLRPGGRLAIVEMGEALALRLLTPPGHWTARATLREELTRAHYRPSQSWDFLPVQHFEIFIADTSTLETYGS